MIEILDNLDLLSRAQLDLTTVEMGGIALGEPATSVPRERITGAQSSVVARYRGGTKIESEYYDSDGRQLTLDEVIDQAAQSDGYLYCADNITYKVRAGKVVGFTTHGPHMSHFAHLTSYEEFLATFGRPNRAQENKEFGELLSCDNYYWGAHKCVRWDAWDNRVSLINLGEYEGNTGPQ